MIEFSILPSGTLPPTRFPDTTMERQRQIQSWLEGLWPGQSPTLAPASADASFRRYFRATRSDGQTRIVMDAPPRHEDVRPWLKVQALFETAGLHVPAVEARDIDNGFLLLSDLGHRTYLSALTPENAIPLYRDALDALVKLQAASHPDVLPQYDHALLRREIDLFPEWYVGRHLGIVLDDRRQADLNAVFERIIAVNLGEARVFVHRDYHSRNLMVLDNANPGIIDFQDAVYGPVSYDAVSLLKDAYIDWDEELALDWLARYWDRARKSGVPVPADFATFHRDYEWMGVQRHLKVLGIFARLYHRDGKEGYLKDMPLVARYLRKAVERYDELLPLRRLLDQLEDKITVLGYTMDKDLERGAKHGG